MMRECLENARYRYSNPAVMQAIEELGSKVSSLGKVRKRAAVVADRPQMPVKGASCELMARRLRLQFEKRRVVYVD